MIGECRNYCKSLKKLDKPYNRAGLPHIKYRIGTYSDFREFILQELDRNQILKGLTYRNPDDPSIALLEGASLLGDILTFYQELYANEAFLRTAQWRESVAALVRLTGYRLSPGLGGTASVAFEVKEGTDVTIPKGFPVKAQLEGCNEPADFETDKEIVAIPALGKFRLYRKTSCSNRKEKISVFSILTSKLEAAGQKIETKDRLLFFNTSYYSNSSIVSIKKVEQKFDRTYFYIDGYVNFTASVLSLTVYKLGRTFRHFGYNAPPNVITIDSNVTPVKVTQESVSYSRNLREDTEYEINNLSVTKFTSKEFPINGEVTDIAPGGTIIIETPKVAVRPTINYVRQETMTWGAVTGAATVMSIDTELGIFTEDIRKIIIHETIGKPFNLENIPKPASDPDGLYYFGDLKTYLKLQNRQLALRKDDGTYAEITTHTETQYISSSDHGVTFRRITYKKSENWPFSEDDFQLDNPTVDVYGNVVKVTQGKKQKEVVLGNGDARVAFQTFKLPKFPLTHVNTETGECEPRIEVYVGGRMWKRVDTLLECKPSDEVYVVREDDESISRVQFGDGKTGRRLPTGSDNITAIYWTGIGAYGEAIEGNDPQAGEKLNRLGKVRLPGVVSGGCEPESSENARCASPGKVQSLSRLVSLKDFESEALAIPGVQMASAVYDILDGTPTILLTVLMENGREKELQSVRDTINRYNTCRGAQRYPVSIIESKHLYVYIDADVGYDPIMKWQVIEKNIREALGAMGDEGNGTDSSHGLFSIGMRGFGENEYATRVEGVMQNVDGVVWVKVKCFSAIKPNKWLYPASSYKWIKVGRFSFSQSVNPLELSISSPLSFYSTVVCDKNAVLFLHIKHLSLHGIRTDQGGNCQ